MCKRCKPNVVILQTHTHTHTHPTDTCCSCCCCSCCRLLPTRQYRPSSRQAASPILPPGSSVPNVVGGGLVSSHAECTEEKPLELLPLGKREDQTLEPIGLAGCYTTLQACYALLYWPGFACLVSLRVNSSDRGPQSDRLYYRVVLPTKVGVVWWTGGRMRGRGLNT